MWHALRVFLCGVCHVAGIVYNDSCSSVYGFVLYCEMEIVPCRASSTYKMHKMGWRLWKEEISNEGKDL